MLSVHSLARDLPERYIIGRTGSGPLEFSFGNTFLCFTPWGTLLVSEGPNRRVQEVNVETRTHVSFLTHPDLRDPTGVCASDKYIAVSSGCSASIVLFTASARPEDRRVLWSCPPHRLHVAGLRFTRDGCHVASGHFCGGAGIALFSLRDGSKAGYFPATEVWDLEECEGGFVVAGRSVGSVHKVFLDPSHPNVPVPLPRSGRNTSMALVPGFGLIVAHCNGVEVLQPPA
jgi:hypothetical protein